MKELISNLIGEHRMWINITVFVLKSSFVIIGLFFSYREFRRSRKEKHAMFWLELHNRFMGFIDLYTKLRPKKTVVSQRTPQNKTYNTSKQLTTDEQSRLGEYLGLFELCGLMIDDKLINEEFFSRAYLSQLKEVVNNPEVYEYVLADQDNWKDLIALCQRLKVGSFNALIP